MAKNGVRCVASTVVNADDTPLFETGLALKKIGFSEIIPKIVRKQDFTEEEITKLKKKYDDFYAELADRVINHKEVYWLYFFGLNVHFLCYFQNIRNVRYCEKDYPDLITLTIDGGIHKCDYDDVFSDVVGNIFDENFDKYSFEKEYIIKAYSKQNNQDCVNNCIFQPWCRGKSVMCQKINHEVECMRLKGLFKYIPKIAEFLVRNYSLKEIEKVCQNTDKEIEVTINDGKFTGPNAILEDNPEGITPAPKVK